jgi:hypothetical protein
LAHEVAPPSAVHDADGGVWSMLAREIHDLVEDAIADRWGFDDCEWVPPRRRGAEGLEIRLSPQRHEPIGAPFRTGLQLDGVACRLSAHEQVRPRVAAWVRRLVDLPSGASE